MDAYQQAWESLLQGHMPLEAVGVTQGTSMLFNPCQKPAAGPQATEEPSTSTSTSGTVPGANLLMPTPLQDTCREGWLVAKNSTAGEADPLSWRRPSLQAWEADPDACLFGSLVAMTEGLLAFKELMLSIV